MDSSFSLSDFERKWSGNYKASGKKRVLLREPEVCMECNRVFLALYAVRSCRDHEGLDELR